MEAALCATHGAVQLVLRRRPSVRCCPSNGCRPRPKRSTRASSGKEPPAVLTSGRKDDRASPGAGSATATEYRDNWFDRLAIDHLSRNLQSITGERLTKGGYDGLIEASSAVARNYCPSEQQLISSRNLRKTVPPAVLAFMRFLLPQSTFSRELCAAFTTVFFSWLVGPCEVKESDHQGSMEKNVVYIKKCRFLEGSNCVGMCVNQCKMPSQKFIKEELGMPVNMVPNFEDMSCEMIFGQDPPAEDVDPALKQGCYRGLCKARAAYNVEDCSTAEKKQHL